ncbi:hypothetical protein GDO78_007485 [Eleutherodactylus coqui]|uniref:Uncharacterized protein n=1 Tax=Eleutherodactylus coqui TaxID=57060 RepID=A0A8J6FI27_ELECQ|nr:hypothetical protein GDO78_007485 [Eleutherodactylus coqui]
MLRQPVPTRVVSLGVRKPRYQKENLSNTTTQLILWVYRFFLYVPHYDLFHQITQLYEILFQIFCVSALLFLDFLLYVPRTREQFMLRKSYCGMS